MRGFRSTIFAAFLLAVISAAVEDATGQQPAPVITTVKQGPARPGGVVSTPETTVSDEEALKAAGLSPTDGARLIQYLKQRTLSDADQGKIAGIIRRFAADDFEERLKATEEIELFGPAAVGPLKSAERDSDPEVAYRARATLKKMSKIPHSAVATAAVRALVKLKPDGASAALLGFLPLADDESNAELIRQALIDLALKDGKPDPALIVHLADPSPIRRAAVYGALTLGGAADRWASIKSVYPELKAAVLKDPYPDAKFAGLWFLLGASREAAFIPEMIGMVPQIGRGRIWQLEDLLLQMAGTHPPGGRFLRSTEALTRARDVWATWWKEKGQKIDFAKVDFKPRILGLLDMLELDTRGYGQSRAVCLGPDLKEKWRVAAANNPTDVLMLAPDRLLMVEANQNMISERTTSGTVLNRRTMTQPMNILKGAEGGVVVIGRNQVSDYDKDWTRGAVYQRPTFDIMAGVRLPGGDVVIVTGAFQVQGPNCIRLDSKLKETGKNLTLGRIQNPQWMDAVGEDKILVCESDKVAEYDLKTGTQKWKHGCLAPTSCQRLINGNTLIAIMNANQVIEVDPSGEVVWDYQTKKDGLRVGRARVR